MKLKNIAIVAAAAALAVGMTACGCFCILHRRFLFCGFFCCRFFRGCKL